MDKQHLYIRVLMHRAFVVFLAVFLISDVGTAYAGRNLNIIAQQGGGSQTDTTRVEAEKLTEEGTKLYKQGTAESLVAARKKWEAALVLWRKLEDKNWQAIMLTGIGRIYSDLGEKQKALQFYDQALPLYRAVGDKRREAATLNYIGRIYSDLGEKQKALQFYNQALPLRRGVGDKRGEAATLNNIGFVYDSLGEKQKALQFYNQALPLLRGVGDKGGEATTLNNIGRVYDDLGEKQKALQFYNQALPLYRAVGDRGGEFAILNNIGRVYHSLGEKQKAHDHYNQALILSRQIGDKFREAITINNIGGVYSSLGEKQKALSYYNQALASYRQVGDRSSEASTLNNIGGIYYNLGEKQKALQFYNQALLLCHTIKHKACEASTINGIGAIYSDLGEKEQALSYYKQALLLWHKVQDKTGKAITLNNIGKAYSDLAEKYKALSYFKQALSLRREIQDKVGEAITLNNIGAVYSDVGDKQQALSYYKQVLSLWRVLGDKNGEAITLSNIGLVYSNLGKKKQAISYYKQTLLLFKVLTNKESEATTLANVALFERNQGNLQEGLTQIEKAIEIIEKLRTKITNSELRTSYFASRQDIYKFYIDLLMELHKKAPLKEYNALALNISERSRARSLIELLAQSNAKLSKNVDPELIIEEKELQIKRLNQEKILAQLINQIPLSKDTIKQTETAIQNIINQKKQLRAKIRAQNPERDKITNPEPLKLPQIQQQLDKDTVLLQYSLGEERSYLWLVTPTSLTSYELPKDSEIEKIASEFYKSLSMNGFSINSSQALSKMLLEPVKDKLAGKRLVIVADGILQQIPFAALHDLTYQPQSNKNSIQNQKDSACTDSGGLRICQDNNSPNKQNDYQPLFVNHEIVNLPSASTIAIQREKIAKRQIAPKKIAILADPVYSSNKKQVTSKQTRSLELELERSSLERSAKSLNRKYWKRLPGTAEEAKAILELVPSKSSLSAFRFDANYNWATSKNLNQYQILHFATHGFVNHDQPQLSGIVLSLFNKDGEEISGHLRLADLFEQDYPAELIVLSACETGLGKNVSGEGLVGLTRGLMYAGGARVALSLWQVSDEGTSVLMQEFYKQMLQENKTPSQALQAAQRKLWSNPQWRSPYYWAAFTLQGEWK